MMRAIALDDESAALDVVRLLAEKVSVVHLEACFTDCFAALDYSRQRSVDLVFLDINMPDMTGLEWLQAIANPPLVVFTTAYSEHAVQSYELNAVDYLLKPFSTARFLQACHKATTHIACASQPHWQLLLLFSLKAAISKFKLCLPTFCTWKARATTCSLSRPPRK